MVHPSEQPHQLWLQVARGDMEESSADFLVRKAPFCRARQNRRVLASGRRDTAIWVEYGEIPQVSASAWLNQEQRTRPNPPETASVEPISLCYTSVTLS